MPSLPSKHLGHNGPRVPSMGLGLMGMSAFYEDQPDRSDEARLKFLDTAHAAGQFLWDTADVYGDSEDLVGKWFAKTGKRSEIILMTKFGCHHVDGTSKVISTPEYAKEACQKSLDRLGIDFIDIYFCQRPDGKTPIEKTIKAMVQLKEAGKIRHLGMSQCSADSLRRAHAVHPITAVQIEYSPFFLDSERNGLFDAALELGITLIPYSPLGRGFGTGKFDTADDVTDNDIRSTHPRFTANNWASNSKLVKKLKAYANRKGCTLPQLILAWEMAQGRNIVPIPGATTVSQLHEDLGAFDITIGNAENAEIRQLIEQAPQVGGIYPHADSKALFADTPPMTTIEKLEDPEDLYLTMT